MMKTTLELAEQALSNLRYYEAKLNNMCRKKFPFYDDETTCLYQDSDGFVILFENLYGQENVNIPVKSILNHKGNFKTEQELLFA